MCEYKYYGFIMLCIMWFGIAVPKKHISDGPRLVVVLVIDQLSYRMLQKISPHLTGGLRDLLHKGIVYTNAHQPHGVTCTATGHVVLNTGVYPKDHGIVNNQWLGPNGIYLDADDDLSAHAAVIGINQHVYQYGKSPINIMIDGISDQFVLENSLCAPHHCFALSLKSRSAIMCAGKKGKALWFDSRTGRFTSSKYYYEQLPVWLERFNNDQAIDKLESVEWQKAKPLCEAAAYALFDSQESCLAQISENRLLGATITIKKDTDSNDTSYPYDHYCVTPHAQALLFEAGKACLQTHLSKKNRDRMLLWLSFSGLDIIGHEYGQFNEACVDLMYHFDQQLRCFMRFIHHLIGHKDCMFILVADHGMGSHRVDMQAESCAQEAVPVTEFLRELNSFIEKKYSINDFIYSYLDMQLYFNRSVINTIDTHVLKNIIDDLKQYIAAKPFIKKVLSGTDLITTVYDPHTIEWNIKQHYYPGRSGDLFILPHPYHEITPYLLGSGHVEPYTYNSHVPLILYRHNHHELKKIHERVYTTQLANSIAHICYIPQPSGSTEPLLPGLYHRRPTLIF